MAAFIITLVAGDAASFVVYFDMARIKPYLDCPIGRRRRRIEIGPHPDAAEPDINSTSCVIPSFGPADS